MLLNGQNLKCCSIWQVVLAFFIAHLFHILNTCYGLSHDDVNVSMFFSFYLQVHMCLHAAIS
jgi:hypothetical protein